MNILHIKNRLLIYFAFSVALLILVAIFYLTYQTEKQRQISTSWLLHTHEVLVESERLHSLIKDAQHSQRGYLLTSDSIYLKRYFNFKDAIDADILDLQKRTADQPEH